MEPIRKKKTFATICCVCQRKKGKNGWRRDVVKSVIDLSHGYCPECYHRTMIGYGLAHVAGASLAMK